MFTMKAARAYFQLHPNAANSSNVTKSVILECLSQRQTLIMPGRLELPKRIQIVLWFAKYENVGVVQRLFTEEFDEIAPSYQTIKDIHQRFTETGSVADLPRTGEFPSSALLCHFTNFTNIILFILLQPSQTCSFR